MTAKEVAAHLARTLKKHHPSLIQNYAVSHIEYTLHRALNAMVANDESEEDGQKKERASL